MLLSATAGRTVLTDPATGNPLPAVSAYAVYTGDLNGVPADGVAAVATLAGAAGNIFSIDVSHAKAVFFSIGVGSGGSIKAQVTIDGAAWLDVPIAALSNHAPYAQTQLFAPSGSIIYGFNVIGAAAARLVLSGAGAGTTTVAHYRTSSLPIPDALLRGRPIVVRWTTGAAGVIRSGGWSAVAAMAENTNAAARYLQIYNKNTAPVPGTDTPIQTLKIAANSFAEFLLHEVFYGAGIAWAITTEFAGATAAASGDVVGSVIYR